MLPEKHTHEPEGAHGKTNAKICAPECPCCGSQDTYIFYQAPTIPVHSSILLKSAEAARSLARRDLELAFCNECGFGFNHIFDEDVMRYSADFEESQHFSDTFSNFARGLAREIVEQCDLKGKNVLEIGCGKGEFLRELCHSGDAIGLGIDPAYRADPGRSPNGTQAKFIPDFFSAKYKDLPADVIVCRHTLEHIAPVQKFVRNIRRMIGSRNDVWVVFEVPDFKRVLREGAFWDIYYEHCSYFSPGTHARLFRNQSFEVTSLELAYNDQYIIQYAKPARSPTKQRLELEADLLDMRALADRFSFRASCVQNKWRQQICDAHKSGRCVVLWGSGSKAVSFLNTLSIGPEVEAVVDVNPYKQGKFTPGTAHRIIAPGNLSNQAPDLVVVMNAIYVPEIARTLDSLGLNPEIVSLEAN